jgi:hypothetical protein
MSKSVHAFDDPAVADTYAERVERFVPLYRDVHRMAAVLIDEHAPQDARVLVLGAGGGLETRSFAQTRPGWSFDAVDPAAAMLGRRTAAEVRRRLAGWLHRRHGVLLGLHLSWLGRLRLR